MRAVVVIGLAVLATAHRWPLFAVALVLTISGYGVTCWLWPFGRCRRCRGTGKNIGSTGRRYGTHKRCGGTGRRLRFGTRIARRAVRRKEL